MSQQKNWYDKSYKLLLLIPIVMLIFSFIYLFQFTAEHGDIIKKDVSITGGTTITVFDSEVNIEELRTSIRAEFSDAIVRGISDIRTGTQQAFFVETTADSEEVRNYLENYLGYSLTTENSSIEFTGASISQSFYQQLRAAVLIAFILMAGIIFLIFRTPVPSLAVIVSAFLDILFTIVVINLFGMSLSTGGIVALLMLIGYSVDTDVMLTTRILRKKDEPLNARMVSALKTGMTMTLTSIAAIGVALAIIYTFSETLTQIFTILLIGLGFDIFNTWITNASILKWFAEVKKIE